MPTCSVPGCTSGYPSNSEKVHFFTIPKDLVIAEKLRIAMKRTDACITTRLAVCAKHFVKNEILWQRELLGPDSKVLGVSQYKVPRLRKGTVPSKFSWDDWTNPVEPDQVQRKPPVIDKKDNASDDSVHVLPSNNNDGRISAPDSIVFQEPGFPSIESTSLIQMEQQSVETRELNFQDIVRADLDLPPGWIKQIISCVKKQLTGFYILKTVETEGICKTGVFKEVIVAEDLSIQVNVLGEQLDLRRLNISCPITDVHEVQNLLFAIHRLNVCRGCWEPPVKPEIEQLSCEKLKKDFSSTWRHVECPLLLSDKKVCVHCNKTKHAIDTNLRRYIQGKVQVRRKKKVDLREQKKQLLKMQAKYRSAMRIKRLARQKMKSLKQEVFEMRQKMANGNTLRAEKSPKIKSTS